MWTTIFFTGELLPKSDLNFFIKMKCFLRVWTIWRFLYWVFSSVFFLEFFFHFSKKKLEFFSNVNSAKFLFFVKFFQIFDIKEIFKKNLVFTVLPWVYMVNFSIFISYLICSQIWLNLPMDDCHLGYSKNILKKHWGLFT